MPIVEHFGFSPNTLELDQGAPLFFVHKALHVYICQFKFNLVKIRIILILKLG
jgi:hypothetical protein